MESLKGIWTIVEDERIPLGEVWVYGRNKTIEVEIGGRKHLCRPDAKIVNIKTPRELTWVIPPAPPAGA